MHHGPFLAERQPRRHGEDQAHHLDDEGPLAQVAADDEPAQDCLDLRNTWKKGTIVMLSLSNRIVAGEFVPACSL